MSDARIEAMMYWQGFEGVRLENGVLKEVGHAPPHVILSEGIIGLSRSCFSGQADLEWVVLPSNLQFVDEYVFSNCPKLTIIGIYAGQERFKNNLLYGNVAELCLRRR